MATPHIEMGKPRTGEVPLKDFTKPGAPMAVLGLCPGSEASAALVHWTNPVAGRFPAVDPAGREIRLLAKLPSEAPADGTHRRLDIPAAREMLHAALATLPPGCQTYAYLLDSSQGADYAGDPAVAAVVAANLERASHVLLGLPLARTGRVSSNARSRSLKVGKNKKTKAALQTAAAVFPQVEGRLKVAKNDWPLAGALLTVAHVIGATARPMPAQPAAAAAQPTAAPAAAGRPSAAAAAGAAAAARAAAAAAAAAGDWAAVPQAAVKQKPQQQAAAAAGAAAAGNWAAPQVVVKQEPQAAQPAAAAAATPVVVTPGQRPKRPMRGAGAGGRSRKRAAAAGDFDFAGDD